ncbi:hypothetical protein [Thalassomonas sp. RHCl1]|uniref:hypothetical protein n=1 Tax=Thalassomonas sp. RHCl1 TaxID=2995320 RepID=UPI00248C256C|nr:hypothetical protein [Thalassomonas sp. RHCl1]
MKKKLLVVRDGGGFGFETSRLYSQLKSEFDLSFLVPQDKRMNREISEDNWFEVEKITSIYEKNKLKLSFAFMKSMVQIASLQRRHKFETLLCVGSSIAVPMFIVGGLFRTKRVFIESHTRVNDISSTTKILLKFGLADRIYVQWPELANQHEKLLYKGNLL